MSAVGRKTSQLFDGSPIGVETLQLVEDTDDLAIWSLRLSWRHGIYGTAESYVVTVVQQLDDETREMVRGYVVDDGVISPLDEGDERHAVLARHIVTVTTPLPVAEATFDSSGSIRGGSPC